MICIRTDMNEKIASGHVMRCLSIADALKRLGASPVFILSDSQAAALLEERGHPYIVLGSAWDSLEGELYKLEGLIKEKQIKLLLVDSYYVTPGYLQKLEKATHVMYLADNHAFHYPVDSLICYGAFYEKFHYSEQYTGTELLLGTKYAPLRKEFDSCPPKQISPKVNHILLTSGGTDEFDMLDRILGKIDKQRYEHIYAICGVYYKKYEELTVKYKEYPGVEILKAVSHIETYMQAADVAISAAGSTLYELAALGTPTISYVIADNQLENAAWWDEKGLISYAGDGRTEEVVNRILKLLYDTYEELEMRKETSVRLKQTVDGKGAERIARKMLELADL